MRPYVLLLLLDYLIDQGHEVFRGKGSAALLKQRMRDAVAREYPMPADHGSEEDGFIPASVAAVLAEAEAERKEERVAKEAGGLLEKTRLMTDKNASPGDGARPMEECLQDLRPKACTLDRSTEACTDPETLRAGGLERYGELHVETGSRLVDQYHSKYPSQIFPFVIPRMVSGPDYTTREKWRRNKKSAKVSVPGFCRAFARRSEAQCRTDWSALPTYRSAAFKYTAEHTMTQIAPYTAKRDAPSSSMANEYVEAMQELYHALHHGSIGRGVHRVPVRGDTSRLPYANSLSPIARRLAYASHFLAQHMAGTQQVRQLMYHRQFGARVVYGDCLFFTISPNEQHSALTLRLSRFRQNDPYIKNAGAEWQRLAAQDFPPLEAKRYRKTVHGEKLSCRSGEQPRAVIHGDEQECFVELPPSDMRRVATARDPLAVIDSFRLEILLRLAWALGVRMCPKCPRCNERGLRPCQDKFGNNMRPMGGLLGGMPALGSGMEHQGHGTPHLHAEGHVACIYQFGTLAEIAEKIAQKMLDPRAVVDYHAWLHKEDPFVEEQHQAFKPEVDEQWRQRFADRGHESMCYTPEYMTDDGSQTLWSKMPSTMPEAQADAADFRKAYFGDAQFIFSRVQHHIHQRTKKGYVPLKSCVNKKCKKKSCKADFPKTHLVTDRAHVICRGLAGKFGLRISGRRNAFGSTIGRRTCEWQSGTTPGFAVIFRSNTHTQPNYRLPITEETHDGTLCKRASCVQQKDWKIICKLAQRAQREATGYYCGYTFKAQPVGKKMLKGAAESLSYVATGMRDKTPGQQWHRITHRALQDLQHKCMLRTAPEEWNLAANWHEQDVTNAEFIRTYRSVEFPGGQLLRRLELEDKGATDSVRLKAVPVRMGAVGHEPLYVRFFEEIYGYRGQDEKTYHLNPWEFLMAWKIEQLRPPSASEETEKEEKEALTKWKGVYTEMSKRPRGVTLEAGVHYEAKTELQGEYLRFLSAASGPLQHQWCLRRRSRPVVPAPNHTPMPDKQPTREGKSKLLSLYLRPWVFMTAQMGRDQAGL